MSPDQLRAKFRGRYDVIVARVYGAGTDGFYVDVGAGDPVNMSVTKWSYDLGWNGINVEPNSTLFQRLVDARPREKIV
jgi:hypothetical protein